MIINMKKLFVIIIMLCLSFNIVFAHELKLNDIEKYKTINLFYSLGSLVMSIYGLNETNGYSNAAGVVFFFLFGKHIIRSVYSYKEISPKGKLNLIYEDYNLKLYEKIDNDNIFYQIYKNEKRRESMMFKPNLYDK